MISTSISSNIQPETPDFVRARAEFGGYYLEDLEPDENGGRCKVISISQGHGGGGIPIALARKTSTAGVPRFIKALQTAISQFGSS